MKAKEYLREIKRFDICIEQKKEQLNLMIERATPLSGIDYSKERVQVSKTGSGFTKGSDEIIDLKNEIDKDIDRFYIERNKIINEIQGLEKSEYCDVLYRRYVSYECFEEISLNMFLSYNRTIHIHGEALKAFESKYLS